jgi:hypothetical protein
MYIPTVEKSLIIFSIFLIYLMFIPFFLHIHKIVLDKKKPRIERLFLAFLLIMNVLAFTIDTIVFLFLVIVSFIQLIIFL